jgi:hypothetical protein
MDTGGSCAVAAVVEETMAAVAAVVTAENTAVAAVVVAVDVGDGVVDAGRGTAAATTRSASALLVGPVREARTDAKADAPVSFPDALPDPADDKGARR